MQQKQVIATQPISLDFTLSKYEKYAQIYQSIFLQTSGANPSSWVSYTQVVVTGGGRRLKEGTSVAKWTLAFDSDEQATAAQAARRAPRQPPAAAKPAVLRAGPRPPTLRPRP